MAVENGESVINESGGLKKMALAKEKRKCGMAAK
jgi:hypothetical protein